MFKNLFLKFKESFFSVLPIAVLIIVASLCSDEVDNGTVALFTVSAALLIIGMAIFTLGADVAMIPIGSSMGSDLSKRKNILLVFVICFVLGFIITIAEPDLQVLAEQLQQGEGKNVALLIVVAAGVGLFLVVALARIYFKLKLSYILLIAYGLVFLLAAFVPEDFLTIAFDSGGVTTGPITVPFLMALGIGIAGVRGGDVNRNDSFGVIALCSIGPVLAVLVLGLTGKSEVGVSETTIPVVRNVGDIFKAFGDAFPDFMLEVLIALLPIMAVFALFQIFALKLPKTQVLRICFGLIYTFVGLCIFLTAVNVGFLPMGKALGAALAKIADGYVLIPFGVATGCLIVLAEPSVHILTRQVEQLTGGAISKLKMLFFLSLAISVSVGLSMLRVATGISIWYFLLPCYAISVALAFFVPEIFTAVAFDSGGVASGAMTSTFLLPFAIGACVELGGNVFTDAYGLVAFVAMTPLLTLQLMGLAYKVKTKVKTKIAAERKAAELPVVFDEPVVFFERDDEGENPAAEGGERERVSVEAGTEAESDGVNGAQAEAYGERGGSGTVKFSIANAEKSAETGVGAMPAPLAEDPAESEAFPADVGESENEGGKEAPVRSADASITAESDENKE